ncbi:diguanylate cyclase domain-containing protein [Paenibacillus allorhizosphaerae]|uniref:GGDEF domain-containing protein n=1 Tax=Paenibacillus allorhizosphaerae TaxID=2849866 RepID=A0ABN7TSS7_9BACL|nr:sensor domain-containing diguanylate cyclase [Paenibacillus allorhizosphaerae]CAG7647931.1 hypothetical protein PAECIP111802_04100 [Paenibacillus allorhizosphaerae]
MDDHLSDFADGLLRAAVQQSPDWLWIFGASGLPVCVAPASCAGIGLYETVYESDLASVRASCDRLFSLYVPFRAAFRVVQPDGLCVWLEGSGYAFLAPDGQKRAALSAKDITQYKQMEDRLTRLAYYDPLTGLPNRRLFQDRMSQALHTAKRYQHKLAVMYLDMDDFKNINDTYGHATGDELLTKVASRLSHSIREPDTVSRMGGDEFVLLLQQFLLPDDIAKIARRISNALNQPFDLNGQKITLTCSIGAAFFPEHGDDSETLLQNADAAMYASKLQGKNHFHFYSNTE